MKSLLAGIILGAAALVIAPHVHIRPVGPPIPLCPPVGDCNLDQ